METCKDQIDSAANVASTRSVKRTTRAALERDSTTTMLRRTAEGAGVGGAAAAAPEIHPTTTPLGKDFSA